MTAQALFVKYRYTDENGIPLSGGKVHTFETDGVTPKDSYSDADGTSPNTNPVILDSAGQADIYIDGAYFVQVTDSLDNLICEGVVIDSYSAAQSVVGDIQTDLDALTSRVDSNDTAIAGIEDDVTTVSGNVSALQTALTALTTRVTALEGSTAYQLPVNTVLTFAEDISPSTFATRMGYGAWVIYGEGRVIVGAGTLEIDYSSATGDAARSNESKTLTVGQTDGEFTHKQTTAEMRQHSHGQRASSSGVAGTDNAKQSDQSNTTTPVDDTSSGQTDTVLYDTYGQLYTDNTGSSTPFNVMQPYIVAKHFKRTA